MLQSSRKMDLHFPLLVTWGSLHCSSIILFSGNCREVTETKAKLTGVKIVANIVLQNCTFPEKGENSLKCWYFILNLCLEWTWKCFYYPLALLSVFWVNKRARTRKPGYDYIFLEKEPLYVVDSPSRKGTQSCLGKGCNDKECCIVLRKIQLREASSLIAEQFP